MSTQEDIKFINELMMIYFVLLWLTDNWILRAILIWRNVNLFIKKVKIYASKAKDNVKKNFDKIVAEN